MQTTRRVACMGVAAFVLCCGPAGHAASPASQPASQPELALDLGGHVTLTLIRVPAGRFTMGSPATEPGRRDDETAHEVTITRPFFLARTETTQEQYQAIVGRNPSQVRRLPACPVDSISWFDAEAFCRKVAARTSRTVRLPTEAEWEYACRAGSKGLFCCGDDAAALRKFGVFYARSLLPAGQLQPNVFGLFDMHGGVHEWCSDWYGDYPDKAATDPLGPAKGDRKVLRGGCFHNTGRFCRSASRVMYPPAEGDYDFGFRIVVEDRPAASQPAR